ncbi:MAG TPA: extracellular solute-binding protein [Bauldia sp.]|nr:extracellular solute-binding protein [Bauldia sp.]
MKQLWTPSRRQVLAGGATLLGTSILGSRGLKAAEAADTVRVYGISSMALKDWDAFTELTGLKMEFTPVTYDTGTYVREIVGNDIGSIADIFIFTGNTPRVLAPAGAYTPIDVDDPRIALWKQIPDTYKLTADCTYDGKVYGVPIVNNADSFGFWPSEIGVTDPRAPLSWELMFESEKTKGRVALDRSFTYSMSVMAQWVKQSGQAPIDNPADLKPEEAKAVADYGIARKRAGQFRTFFSSLDEQVDLLARKEVIVLNCWEPCIKEVNNQVGADSVFYAYSDYYYQWGDAAYVSPSVTANDRWDIVFKTLNFFMGAGGAYRALQAVDRGYGGPNMDLAIAYARAQNWPAERIAELEAVGTKVDTKFKVPDFWGQSSPEHADVMEEEWQRFLNA